MYSNNLYNPSLLSRNIVNEKPCNLTDQEHVRLKLEKNIFSKHGVSNAKQFTKIMFNLSHF